MAGSVVFKYMVLKGDGMGIIEGGGKFENSSFRI